MSLQPSTFHNDFILTDQVLTRGQSILCITESEFCRLDQEAVTVPAQTSFTASALLDLEDLTALAAELDRHGLKAELKTPSGKLPYLHVSNPEASVLTERVYAQADSFWFSWADRIAGCDELPTVAAILVRVLRTVDTPGQ